MLHLASVGDPGAQVCVGCFYSDATGTRRVRERAMYWFRRAHRNGDAAAAANIGTIYRDEGRPKLAERWFREAVRLGLDDAWLELAKLYLGALRNPARARAALKRLLAAKNIAPGSREEGRERLAAL